MGVRKNLLSRKHSDDAEVRRVEVLYDGLPSAVVVALIGIFLCFLVLFGTVRLDLIKAWTAYMLSILAVRIWVWYMFRKADRQIGTIRRWEWAFAVSASLSAGGWGMLFGPLYPSPAHPDAQMFIALMVVITAFTGSVFVALSNVTFWLFILPTLTPAILHYATTLGNQQWPVTAAACCTAVFIIVQRTLYRSATDGLQRSTEAEALLAEQNAIFESSPMGIAVIDNKQVVKCNTRFAELLGRRIQDLTTAALHQHFVDAAEAEKFLADRAGAFEKGHPAQGVYRLRRADGSQFWAEFSGRKMAGGPTHSVWMVADVTLRVANERRTQSRDRP